jgi:hypothetical protein
MAFIVETSTGYNYTPGANSYASDTEATAYFSERGNPEWTGSATVKQAALIRATAYIDARYGELFKGRKVNALQPLAWPRLDAFDPDVYGNTAYQRGYPFIGIPLRLKVAVYEAAVIALGGDLMPPGLQGTVKSHSEGAISDTYAGGAALKTYQMINAVLCGMLRPIGQTKVSR